MSSPSSSKNTQAEAFRYPSAVQHDALVDPRFIHCRVLSDQGLVGDVWILPRFLKVRLNGRIKSFPMQLFESLASGSANSGDEDCFNVALLTEWSSTEMALLVQPLYFIELTMLHRFANKSTAFSQQFGRGPYSLHAEHCSVTDADGNGYFIAGTGTQIIHLYEQVHDMLHPRQQIELQRPEHSKKDKQGRTVVAA
jgi:hypothetical protein